MDRCRGATWKLLGVGYNRPDSAFRHSRAGPLLSHHYRGNSMSTTIFTTATTSASIESAYKAAQERYAALGVDTEAALKRLAAVPVSLHCWQGDDVGGFEKAGEELGGGLAVTGNYPGKARTPDELRSDAVKALSLIPGKHRFNLHACYAETGGKRVDRNELCPEHFKGWIDWCKEQGLGMDFNPTYFAHPKAADGMTLAHPDAGIRKFWIEHGIACRKIGAAIGAALGKPCVTNVVDSRRHEGPAGRSRRPAAALDRGPRRDLRRPGQSGRQPRCRREQALRHRLGELRRRLARVLSGLRHHAEEAALPRHGPLPSHGDDRRQDFGRLHASSTRSCCTSAAASAGTATTW